jgi:Protein phosphatase 2C
MRLSTDCSFHIGTQHLRSGMPCQDYAACGNSEWGSYAIVSDGCSSGGRTDIGSRLLTLGIEASMRGEAPVPPDELMDMFGLDVGDLLATSIVAEVRDDGLDATVTIKGDGAAAFVGIDGTVEIFMAEWAGNMPWYPAYILGGADRFIAAHAEHGGSAFKTERWFGRAGEALILDEETTMSAESFPRDGWSMRISRPLRAVAVFTDGIMQVDAVDWRNVALDLIGFRSTSGDFVKRRMNRFLHDAAAKGRGPIDDISMACILVEEKP